MFYNCEIVKNDQNCNKIHLTLLRVAYFANLLGVNSLSNFVIFKDSY